MMPHQMSWRHRCISKMPQSRSVGLRGIFKIDQETFDMGRGIGEVEWGIIDLQWGTDDVEQGIVDVHQARLDVPKRLTAPAPPLPPRQAQG
jgi:hypothetical protein